MSAARSWARDRAIAVTRRVEATTLRHNWASKPEGAWDRPSADSGLSGFNQLLHELRSNELSRTPKVSGTLLSAGCSGSMYFDWIARHYGPVSRHIGLELYLEQPPTLPPEVEWLKTSVADMVGVTDQSVQLVFSGQNIEHLFGDDAVDFLRECHRVVEPGGWLVIDSPQRDVASALGWTQPEHTVEFNSSEAAELVTLAGFDVVNVRGLWLCHDPATGARLPLWPADDEAFGPVEVVRRSVLGATDPENSFVWWLEARRADREPAVEALRKRHAEIFAVAWPERQQRFHHLVGTRSDEVGHDVVSVPRGVAGQALFGPFMPLVPGRYDVSFRLRGREANGSEGCVAVLDAADVAGTVLTDRRVLAGELPAGEWVEFALSFEVRELTWGGQFRVHSTGRAALDVEFHAALREHDASPAPTCSPS